MSTLTSFRPRRRGLWAATLAGLALAVLPMTLASAADSVVYDNIPSPQPGNVPSVGFEATTTGELGDQIQLAGTVRKNLSTTVLMSSWGCQTGSWSTNDCQTTPGATFTEPVTLNVYAVNADNSPGASIATVTKTFTMPYRPSKSAQCADGKWFSTSDATCYNGYAFPITFPASTATWPSKVIVSVAYNTTHYGYAPIGEQASCYSTSGGCGYDSLNVGTNPAPTTGTDSDLSDAYVYGSSSYAYCSGPAGTFRQDAGCWTGYQPAIRVAATHTSPDSAADCKNGGWQQFTDPSFKNQGDCVSYTQMQKH